jgi:predicted DNA-binding antitoxin AbrB/MazE fold protein
MAPVEAVYENGVFRPITPVPASLRDGTRVLVEPLEPRAPVNEQETTAIREILAHRYRSGVPDTAARHDEHQP